MINWNTPGKTVNTFSAGGTNNQPSESSLKPAALLSQFANSSPSCGGRTSKALIHLVSISEVIDIVGRLNILTSNIVSCCKNEESVVCVRANATTFLTLPVSFVHGRETIRLDVSGEGLRNEVGYKHSPQDSHVVPAILCVISERPCRHVETQLCEL